MRHLLCFSLLMIVLTFATDVRAIDYAWAAPLHFPDGRCVVIIHIKDERSPKTIEYQGAVFDDHNCIVEVPKATFEKEFRYCALSGMRVEKTDKKILAVFGGGPAGGREKYWFEWGDVRSVFPTFYCMRNK